MNNYFKILDIQEFYDLDVSLLEGNYKQAQLQYHPDKFAGASGAEKLAAAKTSAEINDAYKVLKSPLKRAEYLLKSNSIMVNTEQDSIKPSPELLMESMEYREKLSNIKSSIDLDKFKDEVQILKDKVIEKISEDFTKQDLEQAAQDAIRLKYLEKLLDEIRQKRLMSL